MLYPNSTNALCITVRRGSILDDTIFSLRPGFDEKKHIKVRFLSKLDECMLVIVATLFFVGEPGIDEGGPKREFLSCCLMLFQTIAHFLKVPLPEGCYGTTQVHSRSLFQFCSAIWFLTAFAL